METFTLTMLGDDKTGLLGRNTELDNLNTEPLNDGVTKELVLMTVLITVSTVVSNEEMILLTVGTRLGDGVSISIAEVLFCTVVLFC